MMIQRDPEEVGPESMEDITLRMDVQASFHEFNPGPDGRCTEHLVRHGVQGVVCGSTQQFSYFHIDTRPCWRGCCGSQQEHSERHDHGGGDCMCFEGYE